MKLRLMVALVAVLVLGLGSMQAGDKYIVHHNGEDELGNPIVEDICVSINAVDKHLLNHGDTTEFVPCQGAPEVEPF